MSTSTTNLGLVKPDGPEHALIAVLNENMNKIDGAVGALPSGKTIQGQINETNSNMLPNKATTLQASSLSDLKTVLVGLCNNTTDGSYKPIRYTSAFTSDGFVSGDTYQGFIFVNSQTSSALFFSVALFECTTNMPIYMRYTNGTWNIDGLALNSKVIEDNFTNLCTRNENWQFLECIRIGNIVTIFGRVADVLIGQSQKIVLTIPSGYRPLDIVYAPTVAKDGSGSAIVGYGSININTNGVLSIENNTNGYYNTVNVTYAI